MQNFKPSLAILGTGHALPEIRMPSEQLDTQLAVAKGTMESAGVQVRFFAAPGETAASLGATAAKQALAAAGLDAWQLDVVVAASATMDQALPCNAALIHRELGLADSGIPAFDVNASCLGFIAAIDLLSCAIAVGRYSRVLVVAADIASCGLNWGHRETSALFGDGAAAAVLGAAPNHAEGSQMRASSFATFSSGAEGCRIAAGGSRLHPRRVGVDAFLAGAYFEMDGKAVFRLAAEKVEAFVEDLLAQSGSTRDDLDWIVPHQASELAMAHLTRRLGFDSKRVVNIFADHGNQVAASLPTALDIAIRDGRIRRGQRVLLLGTGAGLSIGGIVLDY